MRDQLISFKTAKLAKEKGFDGKCNYHYISNSYMEEYYKPYIKFQYDVGAEMNHLPPLSNVDFKVMLDNNLSGKSYIWTKAITAPTQSLLQRWLRETHNVHIDIHAALYAWNNKNSYLRSVYKILGKHIPNKYISYRVKEVSSYEEALEIGLLEGLQLIK